MNTYTTRQIIDYCHLVDFVEGITNEYTLIGTKELHQWSKYFYNKPLTDVQSILVEVENNPIIGEDYFEEFRRELEEVHTPIAEILKLGEGKMCLSCLDSICCDNGSSSGIFDFYFYSCTIDEAATLLDSCLDILEISNKSHHNKETCTYEVRDNNLFVVVPGSGLNVNFYCTIYEVKQELLRNIGSSIFRQGYNFKDKYFSTISGGIMAAMKSMVLNADFQEDDLTSVSIYGVNILLPGISRKLLLTDRITCSNGVIVRDGNYPNFRRKCKICPYISGKYKDKDILPKFVIHNNTYKKCSKITEWIKEWNPTIIGITDDVYVALRNIKSTFCLNKDIFDLLCRRLLMQMATDARYTLLNLCN